MKGVLTAVLLAVCPLIAGTAETERAEQQFRRADYEGVIRTLAHAEPRDAYAQILIGKSYFSLGEFKKSGDAFERAVEANPNSSVSHNWLGKAYGRRAETSNPIFAPGLASKARQQFEKSVELDPRNIEAINDLFSYYLEAPGFLGGGLDKAEVLAQRIKVLDPAEYHYSMAQIAERRKDVRGAEEHFRTAVDLAPRQVGRLIDLARFVSKQGRTLESEVLFQQASKMNPNDPRLLFERASNLIRGKQNLPEARSLLHRYVTMPLSPDDAPRDEALKLLKEAGD
jgi:tetratricopeptide (TPR) repeat protein